MQKKLFLLASLSLFFQFSIAQIAYYTSAELRAKYVTVNADGSFAFNTTPAAVDSLCAKLRAYLPGSAATNSTLTNAVVLQAFQNNPFFGAQIQQLQKDNIASSEISSGSKAAFSSITTSNSTGGIETNIINGVANLMIQRAKQEIIGAFLAKLQTFFSKHPEIQQLFPKTVALMPNLLNYPYSTLLKTLQSAFQTDLSNLPTNLPGITQTADYQALFKDMPELTVLIQSFDYIYKVVKGQYSVAVALDSVANVGAWQTSTTSPAFQNFRAGIQLTDIFSNSLRADPTLSTTGPNQTWISLSDLGKLVSDTVTFRLYLGLVARTIDNKKLYFYKSAGDTSYISTWLATYNADLTPIIRKVSDLVQITSSIDTLYGDISYKKKNHISLTNTDYYNYINSFINLFDLGADLAQWGNTQINVSPYTTAAKDGNDIYRYLYQAQYDLAFAKLLDFINGILNIKVSSAKDLLVVINTGSIRIKADSLGDMSNKDWKKVDSLLTRGGNSPTVTADLTKLKHLRTIKSIQNTLNDLSKYGTLAAGLATAKTPDDVTAALENAILPVGSASIKKFSKFNIAIQSYLGADLILSTPMPTVPSVWTDKFGVIAPIGVSISKPILGHWSASLFLSIFDLGAVVAYQLKYDSTQNQGGSKTAVVQKSYQVNFGQIVCPGVFGVIGLPKYLPVSVGGGWEYGPGLGKIKTSGTTIANNPQGRWVLFVAVDIPFFNIVNNK
jgi:hypothetical protein